MWWPIKIFLVLGWALLGQSAWALLDGLRFLRLVRKSLARQPGGYTPRAAVVIPCKGLDAGFDANLERFLHQDYPDYQIVFAVASTEDSAYKKLHARLATLPAPVAPRRAATSLVVAGFSDERGEKVNNLLHGIASVDPTAEVYVFADIDAAPAPDWLRWLVEPLANPQTTVSTGFRWYLPGRGFVSRLRAGWDSSVATMLGEHDHNFAWGGSMAIRAADFRRLGIAERYWAHTVSDDYALTRAVREAGGTIAFEPRCLVASREESSLREFLRWSTRQIIITRVYAAHLWKLGLASYLFYCGTLALGLAVLALRPATAFQRVLAAIILITILLLGSLKGYIRTIITRELFATQAGGQTACYWQLTPLVPWVMLWNFVAATLTRRIEWRGTEYDLISRDQVRVTRRSGPYAAAPSPHYFSE